MSEQTIPRWPVIKATVRADGTGELEFAPSSREPVHADDLATARLVISEQVAAYARENLSRPVLLQVEDPDGVWRLGVHPDGSVTELEDDPDGQQAVANESAAPASSGASVNGTGDGEPGAGRQQMRVVQASGESLASRRRATRA